MANPLFSYSYIKDFFRTGDPDLCCVSVTVENTFGNEITLQNQPYPCKAGSAAGIVEVMLAAESAVPANIVGFLVSSSGNAETIADSGKSKMQYAMLVRGPAVVEETGYAPADPHAGSAYAAADFNTWCDTVANPIVVHQKREGLSQGPLYTQANPNY